MKLNTNMFNYQNPVCKCYEKKSFKKCGYWWVSQKYVVHNYVVKTPFILCPSKTAYYTLYHKELKHVNKTETN